ncbi:M56 family metallopeptidase [Telmatobacter bradus]|uniref:M56 family metallopeptidase n=1 Tax=Telmatobacter bradus TaxID=474953 RepID=UPI003B429409
MNIFLGLVQSFGVGAQLAAPVATAVLNALWQSLFLVLVLHFGLKLLPRLQAAHRFLLWLAAFLLVVLLPLLSLASLRLRNPDPGSAAAAQAHAAAAPWLRLDSRWSLLLAAVWLTIALLRCGFLLLHAHRAQSIGRAGQPVELATLPADLQAEMKLPGRFAVELCTSKTIERPCVVGFFRPRILVPDWLLGELSASELRQVVLHELEHLRRLDDFSNLLQKIFLALLPLNPGLFFIERQLCREREMACDEGVVRRTRAPRAYAACLANLAERGLQLRRQAEALALGLFRRRPELVERVESLLSRRRELPRALRLPLVGSLTCALLAATLALGRLPQFIGFAAPADPVALTAQTALTKPSVLLPAPALAGRMPTHKAVAKAASFATSSSEPSVEVAASEPAASEFVPAEASGLRAEPVVAHVIPRRMDAAAGDAYAPKASAQNFAPAGQPVVVFAVYEETMVRRNLTVRDYETGEDAPVLVVTRWTVVVPATAQTNQAQAPDLMIFDL